MTFEQKNENAANHTQGSFTFAAGGGRTAFQNFLSGNADGLCGNACTYTEAQTDVTDAPALQPLRDVRAGLLAAARQPHRRLRRALLAVPAGHRHEQRPDQLSAVASTSPPTRRRARTPACTLINARHRRSAERHHRRRQELAVRRRDLRVRQEQHPAAHRRHLGSGADGKTDLPRLVRRLLRSAARRHLRAERVHQPAVRQHGEHPEPAAVESRRRARRRRPPAWSA